jgi:hypothetical protein
VETCVARHASLPETPQDRARVEDGCVHVPENPALQIQLEKLAGHVSQVVKPNTSEYVPTEQFMHTLKVVAPLTFENVPGGHGMQDVMSVMFRYDPRTHVHCDTLVAPTMLVLE